MTDEPVEVEAGDTIIVSGHKVRVSEYRVDYKRDEITIEAKPTL